MAPVTSEFIGSSWDGLTNLHDIALRCTLNAVTLVNLRSQGYELLTPVANGIVAVVHDRKSAINYVGYDGINGEPDLIHAIAALQEYAVWFEYWDVLGWDASGPVTNGVFSWRTPAGGTLSGSPVAHDLWIDDTGDSAGAVVNLITGPA